MWLGPGVLAWLWGGSRDLSHGGFPPWASVSLAVNRIFPPGLVAVTRVKRNHCTEAAHTQEVRREELGADS